MKTLFKGVLINAFSLFLLSQILSGIKISGGFFAFIIAGFALSVMSFTLKPVLKIITLPLNFVTFGLASFLINVIILYVLTIFIPQVSINAFVFNGASVLGFVLPKIDFNAFFAFVACGVVLSAITSFLSWLSKS